MKTIKQFFLLLSFVAGLAWLTSCGDDEPKPEPELMLAARAPVFVMSENFTITATCPNNYKAFINGVEKTLPYTVTQTYQEQTIVVSGYGYGEGMQDSEAVKETFTVPAMEMPKAEPPVFSMNESFEITATCANSYKAYVNGIETVLPYTVTQTYQQQTFVVSGYGYGFNLLNSDTIKRTFVVPAKPEPDYVDLGLPSGTLWATRNIGASTPGGGGNYFAWGETEPKNSYDWYNYKWCNGSYNKLTKYCDNISYGYNGFVDNKTVLDPEDDAAYVNWGPEWRMPTSYQMEELYDRCTWVWTTYNSASGYRVTGPNGNSIFLPAASTGANGGRCGRYWTRTLNYSFAHAANNLQFSSDAVNGVSGCNRYYGHTVRAVRVSQN